MAGLRPVVSVPTSPGPADQLCQPAGCLGIATAGEECLCVLNGGTGCAAAGGCAQEREGFVLREPVLSGSSTRTTRPNMNPPQTLRARG